jgi:hypothetical protein
MEHQKQEQHQRYQPQSYMHTKTQNRTKKTGHMQRL